MPIKKNIKLINTAYTLVLLGIFFIPFNSFEGFGILGEFDRDSCILFFLLASVFVVLRGKLSIPYKNLTFQILILLLFWVLLTVAFNFQDLSNYYFKQTSGLSRFLRQFISIVISTIVLLVIFYNVLKSYTIEQVFYKIRKVILYSFIVSIVYGTIEYLIIQFNIDSLRNTLYLFDYFPFTSVNIDRWTGRISSVTFEPPAFATYLLSISGWMFSYIFTEKGFKRFVPGFLIVLFSFLCGSRAGFFIIIVQLLVLILFLIKDKKFNKLFVDIFAITIVLGTVVGLFYGKTIANYVTSEINSFKTDDDIHALSNKSRFGIQYAMFQVFLENPVVGTGYGLQAFESKNKYPEWATKDNWEFRIKYLNEEDKSFPPGYNLYLRLLSETGIIGFMIFIVFILSILLWCYNKTFTKQGDQTIIPLAISISMVGFVFNWLKMDTFRIYFFWLCLALIIIFQLNEKRLDGQK